MENVNGVQSSYKGGKHNRRVRAYKRLEQQLKSGQKPLESARFQSGPQVMQDLIETDVTRIKKEIAILKAKI